MVLVIETIGSVDGFLLVVKRIDGLDWLAEYEQTDIAPDQDFYHSKERYVRKLWMGGGSRVIVGVVNSTK